MYGIELLEKLIQFLTQLLSLSHLGRKSKLLHIPVHHIKYLSLAVFGSQAAQDKLGFNLLTVT